MGNKNIDNKIPIYRLTSKKQVIEYYDKWVIKNKYNKDMIDWNYVAPKNSVDLFCKYAISKKIKILDAGCGTGLVGIELIKKNFSNSTLIFVTHRLNSLKNCDKIVFLENARVKKIGTFKNLIKTNILNFLNQFLTL